MRRSTAAALATAALANQVRWARRTRPEPLPAAPSGAAWVKTADGLQLFAEVGGDETSGVTVVMVHGFLARCAEFDMQWQSLGTRARLLRYDHRNHGRSDHGDSSTDVQQLADDLAEVIAQLAPSGDLVLVGHSMGGMTVLALAEHHPELLDRVRAVALLATGAGHVIPDHRLEDAIRLVARKGALGPALLLLRLAAPALELVRPRRTHLVRWATKRLAFGTDDIDPALLSQAQAMLEEPPLTTFASLGGSLLRNDTRPGLERLKGHRVLVVTGSEDILTRPEHSARMAADLEAELLVLPGVGHVLNQTRASETNAALHRLLDSAGL